MEWRVKQFRIMGFRTVLIFSQLGIALAFCLVVVLGFNNVIDTLEGPPSNLPKLVILNLHSQLLRYLLVAIIILSLIHI